MKPVILLVQLGAKGDCVYATTLAHQIRHDYPDCRLIWVISSACGDILHNNPHVDELWKVSGDSHKDTQRLWREAEDEALRLAARGLVQRVVSSQIAPGNFQNFDGTVRPSILRAYGRPITVPLRGHVILDEREENKVREFAAKNHLGRYRYRILVECTAKSGQSHLSYDLALEAAGLFLKTLPDACFLFSTDQDIPRTDGNIISAKEIGYRENIALTRHCTHMLGCGSGITALVTTCDNAAPLPNLQILSDWASVLGSFTHDFEYWGLDAGRFIEMRDSDAAQISEALLAMCLEGTAAARARFHQPPSVHFKYYPLALGPLLQARRFTDAARSLSHVVQRYGWTDQLLDFGKYLVANFPDDSGLLKRMNEIFIRDFCRNIMTVLHQGKGTNRGDRPHSPHT